MIPNPFLKRDEHEHYPGIDGIWEEEGGENKSNNFFSPNRSLDLCFEAYRKKNEMPPPTPIGSSDSGTLISPRQRQLQAEWEQEDRLRCEQYFADPQALKHLATPLEKVHASRLKPITIESFFSPFPQSHPPKKQTQQHQSQHHLLPPPHFHSSSHSSSHSHPPLSSLPHSHSSHHLALPSPDGAFFSPSPIKGNGRGMNLFDDRNEGFNFDIVSSSSSGCLPPSPPFSPVLPLSIDHQGTRTLSKKGATTPPRHHHPHHHSHHAHHGQDLFFEQEQASFTLLSPTSAPLSFVLSPPPPVSLPPLQSPDDSLSFHPPHPRRKTSRPLFHEKWF